MFVLISFVNFHHIIVSRNTPSSVARLRPSTCGSFGVSTHILAP